MDLGGIEEKALLSFGAIAVAGVGAFFGFFFSNRTWRTQTRYTAQKAFVEDGTKFLDDLTILVGRRYYAMRRLIWSIQEQDRNLPVWEEENRVAVRDWNINFWRLRTQIRMLVGDERADELVDYKEDRLQPDPASLHFKFVRTYDLLKKYRTDESREQELENEMRKLGLECSYFIENLTTEFIERRQNLRAVKVHLSGDGTDALVDRRRKVP